MAKILGSFEFSAKGSRGSKHPWDEWLDGQIRRLEAADFGGSIPKHIAHQAKLVATKRGLTVKVQNVDGGVVIQAFKDQVPAVPSEPTEAPAAPSDAPSEPTTKKGKGKK